MDPCGIHISLRNILALSSEFEQEILSHGEDVEVLELAYLRERIEDHIIKMGQRYSLQLRKE